MTFRQTLHNIKTDYLAHSRVMNMRLTLERKIFLFLSPAVMASTLYRFSRYFYLKGLRPLGWFLWQMNTYLTGADITPTSEIGEYFYLGHPVATVISGKIGSHAIVFGQVAIGGDFKKEDIGAGSGLPVIGNNVIIGIRASILGPVEIGDGAVVGSLSLVNKPVPANCTAVGTPAKIIQGAQAQLDVERILNEN